MQSKVNDTDACIYKPETDSQRKKLTVTSREGIGNCVQHVHTALFNTVDQPRGLLVILTYKGLLYNTRNSTQ